MCTHTYTHFNMHCAHTHARTLCTRTRAHARAHTHIHPHTPTHTLTGMTGKRTWSCMTSARTSESSQTSLTSTPVLCSRPYNTWTTPTCLGQSATGRGSGLKNCNGFTHTCTNSSCCLVWIDLWMWFIVAMHCRWCYNIFSWSTVSVTFFRDR